MAFLSASDFYLLRRPLRSIEELFAFNCTVMETGEPGFEENLKALFSSPEMEEAIYIASPDLFHELKKWQNGEKLEPKRREKLLLSLYKYYIRMCTRCTPYGLFAGCAVGSIATDNTDIDFSASGKENTYKHSRLDMNYVAEIAEYLQKDPLIRHQIQFYPNSSLYRVGDTYRYVEFALKNKRRSYFLSSVKSSIYIDKILENAKEGKRLDDLVRNLQETGLNNQEEARDFVEQLIQAQMLISDFEPTVTGEEYFHILIGKLKLLQGTENYTRILEEITGQLRIQDHSVERYTVIKDLINKHFVATSSKDLIQTDLFFTPQKNNLKKATVDSLVQQLEKLFCLHTTHINANLDSFRKKFSARYEEQEIPLLMALDSESGIGYGLNVNGVSDYMPLLKDVTLPSEANDPSVSWGALNKLKHKKITEGRAKGEKIISLSDSDLTNLQPEDAPPPTLSDGYYLFGTWLASSVEHIDKGNYQFQLSGLAGPSAGNLMGRFCHGNPDLAQKLKACVRAEEQKNPTAIYAEIVHLPESRAGNILMRPQLRNYEIPFLGRASVGAENQITIEDLLVSVRQGKIVLRSKKYNREVIPRLTSAHNYTRGLPVYQFLCDLQSQGQSTAIFWDWHPFEQETFLPRVEYKNIILSRARWHLKKNDYASLKSKDVDLKIFFHNIREQWSIPRYVVSREGDNELFIDFENLYCLQNLAQTLRKKNVVLQEFLATSDKCFVRDEYGSYTNEVVIPLKSSSQSVQQEVGPINLPPTRLQRNFIPGSEWLYVKIYTGNKTADKLLTETILPLAQQLLEHQIIDQWFFIRYNDPDSHLRVRFHHSTKPNFWMEVLQQLYTALAPALAQGLFSKVVNDTYQREIERYGTATMIDSEKLFFSDSVAITEFLDLIEGDEGERYRWLFALLSIDTLLDDFDYTLVEKCELLKNIQSAFYQEFNKNNPEDKLLHSLNDKYRQNARLIETTLNSKNDPGEILPIIECLERRSFRNRPIVASIRYKATDGQAGKQLVEALMPSYIHMAMNRTFISRQRMHELVIYHYLTKFYTSQMARQKSYPQVSKSTKELVQA